MRARPQVHRATLLTGESVVIKVQRPGLRRLFEIDLNNLRILKYLSGTLNVDEDTKNNWYRHWVDVGLQAFEKQLALQPHHRFCHGDTPTMADCVLVPQIFNAQRFKVDLSGFPLTMAVFHTCMALPAFQQAQPSACPDFEP